MPIQNLLFIYDTRHLVFAKLIFGKAKKSVGLRVRQVRGASVGMRRRPSAGFARSGRTGGNSQEHEGKPTTARGDVRYEPTGQRESILRYEANWPAGIDSAIRTQPADGRRSCDTNPTGRREAILRFEPNRPAGVDSAIRTHPAGAGRRRRQGRNLAAQSKLPNKAKRETC